MSKLRFFIIYCMLCGYAQAQDVPGYSTYLNIGYQGNYLIRPGVAVSYDMPIRDLNVTTSKAESLVLQPHVAMFSFIDRNFNLIAGGDFGIVRTRVEKKGASAVSIGLNYLGEAEKTGFTVDLGSGDRSNVQREWRHYFLPTLNYEVVHGNRRKESDFHQNQLGVCLEY